MADNCIPVAVGDTAHSTGHVSQKNIATRVVAGSLALLSTAVCVGMAASAALERASTDTDRVMMAAIAVALVLGSHLLPALSRRSAITKLLFTACIIATVYNHAHFFAGAAHRAGENRAQSVSVSGHAVALQVELDAIVARPMAAVAVELARAKAKEAANQAAFARCQSATHGKCGSVRASVLVSAAQVQALQVEDDEAARAADLRQQLAAAAASRDAAQASQAADPVDAQIAALAGLSVQAVGTVAAVAQSLLLELLGAALWAVALPGAAVAVRVASSAPAIVPVATSVASLDVSKGAIGGFVSPEAVVLSPALIPIISNGDVSGSPPSNSPIPVSVPTSVSVPATVPVRRGRWPILSSDAALATARFWNGIASFSGGRGISKNGQELQAAGIH